MKILSVVGARPQFVKEAALQAELSKYEQIEEILVHTGQHYDFNMSEVFFEVLKMNIPKYNLAISSNLHGEMTGKMMIELEKIMMLEKPDKVLVYGDTNSTIAAAIAASKLKIEIAHIEAGLRQKKPKFMPEEINRVITDHVSNYLFCPSKRSIENLKLEGINEGVYFTGDVMYDIFLKTKNKFDYSTFDELHLIENNYIVMTIHRDFNVDSKIKLEEIFCEINKIARNMIVIYPIHPRTKKRISDFGIKNISTNIKFIEPLDYLKLMGLTERCYKVITDSGGYQKEAYFAGKQAVVLMPETGWVELIEAGYNYLVEPSELFEKIIMPIKGNYKKNIYGDGNAAEKIVGTLVL
jgi:UDP-N-acetylglucosamine 2-epimerase (non-hydrolysing)